MRTLILTLPPFQGGVPAKTRILANELRDRGHDITVAWYAPLSSHGFLDAPLWRIAAGARPHSETGRCFDDTFRSVAVGCWLPELEFTYYLPSSRWRQLIASHDRHVAVGGTTLVSYPLLKAGVRHLVWCACDMLGDRLARRQAMPFARRLFDRAVVGSVQAAMEHRILAGPARIATVANHGRRMLLALGGAPERIGLMPIPTDPQRFQPPTQPAEAGIIGFAGRPNDPRKNVPLLVRAVALARRQNPHLRLRLTGTPDATLMAAVTAAGGGDWVEFTGELDRHDLPAFYGSLDVFAIPSSQEGFGIVGIEAMACGVPVVSTRCGGPEDYVQDGVTGILVDDNSEAMAQALLELTADRDRRAALATEARHLAAGRYAPDGFRHALAEHWHAVWGETP